MKRLSLGLVGLLGLAFSGGACGGQTGGASPSDAGADATMPYAAECADAASPPATLECTGLYTDLASKTLAPGIQPYAPAVPLWSDYGEKQRWIYLPPGTKIDASDPDDWIFPVGTKVWKEFSRDGKRVETRLFQKVQTGFWVRATYAWNADDTAATSSSGGNLPWGTDGGLYHIPTGDECDQCHRGRTDHLLGFEQVSLGLQGATGLTLSTLVAQQLITPPPASTHLLVGDDGTGLGAPALSWIHINCGVSCHNDNSNSTAYGSSMRLRLDPTQLDGRSSVDFDARTTTMNQLATTPTWAGQPRIVPGDPTHSLLVKLITNRGTDNPVDNQMPPIASFLVDPTDTQTVIAWIARMPATPDEAGSADAMVSGGDGAADAGADAGPTDASADAGDLVDAPETGTSSDAAIHDAGLDGD
jgi:hypothetical protein